MNKYPTNRNSAGSCAAWRYAASGGPTAGVRLRFVGPALARGRRFTRFCTSHSVKWLSLLAGVAVLSGCATPVNPFASLERRYEFILETDPPGADVYTRHRTDGELVRIGSTPLTFPIELQRVPSGSEPWNYLQPRVWRAHTSQQRPLSFVELDDALAVNLPQLELRHANYKSESFSHSWRLPTNLMRRDADGRLRPIDRQHRVKTYLQRPSSPQYLFEIELTALEPDTFLYTVGEGGGPGTQVGLLPQEFRVGYAPLRTRDGETIRWLRWNSRDGRELWSHNDDELRFSGYVVREGYDPRLIHDRILGRVDTNRTHQSITMPLRTLSPAGPQSVFRLEVDSLPSGAAVYRLRDDGALGAKLGYTPFELNIGLGQVLAEPIPSQYAHEDWRLWSTMDLVRWNVNEDDSAEFMLHCALYHEDFAVEQVVLPIFELVPGQPMPTGTTLTVPLLRPEQAAARETRQLYQAVPHGTRGAARTAPSGAAREPTPEERPTFIWQTPASTVPDERTGEDDREDGSWWRSRLPLPMSR